MVTFYRAQPHLYRWWVRRTLSRVTSAAVVGESLREAFGPLIPGDLIEVVPNGTPSTDLSGVVRQRMQVLFLSNLRVRKGVLEALSAARIVAERMPDVRFVFAGEWESPELERQARVAASSLNGCVQFLGTVTGHAKRLLLGSSSILLFPPREPEGHPRVVLEALAAGLPVVTTDRGAIGETVRDGVSGFVLGEPNPSELAERLMRLLSDDGLYASMSQAARADYEERFTQEQSDRRLASWLESVASDDT